MKYGVLIYQAPPMLGRGIKVGDGEFAGFSFMGFKKGKKFLEKLQNELLELNYLVTVVKDDTEANLEEIASRRYDFIICTPGLQLKMFLKDELPQIFYLDSVEYYNTDVSKTITNIKKHIL